MKFPWIASSKIGLVLLMTNVYGANYVVDLATDASVNTGGAGSSTSGDFRYVLNQILNAQAQESSPSTNTVTFAVPHVTFTAPPPLINLFNADTITIGNTSGAPTIIDGNNLCRPFFIVQGTATLQNLTIQNGLAQGGSGGAGGAPSGNTGGGGAGAGLGGALFIDSADVIINNVNFVNNGASAGRGGVGATTSNGGGGGGGGMGGNGGNGSGGAGAGGGGGVVGHGGSSNTSSGSVSWGGGGGGAGGNGGSGDNSTVGGGGGAIIGADGGDGSTSTGNNGGTVGSYVFGGGGGGGTTGGNGGGTLPGLPQGGIGGGGGYNAAALSYPQSGGNGGGGGGGGGNNQSEGGLGGGGAAGSDNTSLYGGGGGSGYTAGNGGPGGGGAVTTASGASGSGGFGGGGGGGTAVWPAGDGTGGSGGFGGGGGSGYQTGGNGGGGSAGSNATATAGGDGGACGGAIFVNADHFYYTPASLTVQGNCTFSNSTVSANSGLGAAVGTDLFIYSGNGPANLIAFAPGTGNTVTLNGNVADDSVTSIPASGTWVAGTGPGSSLKMQGPGTLVLQGTNTYVGGTTVQAGRLSVNGSILGGITVNAQGTVGGIGTIYGGGNISGTLSPGNSIGTITLDTTTTGVSLLCKAITNIEIAPTESSLVLITGTNGITLNNTTVNVTADSGDYGTSGTYSILDGVYIGTYDPKVTGGLNGYLYSLSYGSNVIYLDYQIIPISLEGLTHNPKRVANYLMANSAPGTALVNSLSGIPLENALNSISPSRNAFGNYIASQVMFSLSNFLGGHIDDFRSAETGFSAQAISCADSLVSSSDNKFLFWNRPKKKSSVKPKEDDSSFHTWISEFGEVGHQAASTDDPACSMYTGAVLAGVDYDFNHEGLVGGSVGYAYTHFVNDEHRGSGKINYYFGNIYGDAKIGDFYLSPAVWVLFDQVKNKRNISFPGYSSQAKANIYAWQCIPHLEVGYNIRRSLTTITPFTQLDWAVTWQRGYKEHGGGYFNAKVGGHDTSILRSETGVKRADEWGYSWGKFFLKEKLSYVYQAPFGTGNVPTAFVGSPGSFTVTASSINQALNLADLSMKFGAAVGKIRPTLLELACEGQVGPSYWSSQVMFTVKW